MLHRFAQETADLSRHTLAERSHLCICFSMNCKRKHADSNVKAHVRGSSPKGLMIHETGAGISIAVQEMVNPEYKSIQTAIIQCVHINHTMHTFVRDSSIKVRPTTFGSFKVFSASLRVSWTFMCTGSSWILAERED